MMVLLCTMTQPTGVSFVLRASSACGVVLGRGEGGEGGKVSTMARASRMNGRWRERCSSVIVSWVFGMSGEGDWVVGEDMVGFGRESLVRRFSFLLDFEVKSIEVTFKSHLNFVFGIECQSRELIEVLDAGN